MQDLEIKMQLEIVCDECQNELEVTFVTNYKGLTEAIRIAPCEKCLEKRGQEKYDEGYGDGEMEATTEDA